MDDDCQWCRDGLEHCHGTAIHHVRFGFECTEADCQTSAVTHVFSVDCEAIGCPCAVVSEPPRQRHQATAQPIGSAV